MAVKPRYTNSIQQDFAACLRQALVDFFGVNDTICPVLYTGQPIPQTARRCVTYSKLNSHRLGFQGRKYFASDIETDYAVGVIENWTDEIQFQVNARVKETTQDDANTPVARDIIDGITTWINSEQGLTYMREKAIYPLRISDIRNLTSTDESDLFQSIASVDITLQVCQVKRMTDLDSIAPTFTTHKIPLNE